MFAGGLTEELISNLMRFGLASSGCTRPTPASWSSRPPTRSSSASGSTLATWSSQVKGSVRRGPDRVRLIVHLIQAQTGQYLWTETYVARSRPRGVFAIQEQLAADLASQLAQPYGIINEAPADAFRQQRPETLFAYDCVLRALDYRRTQGREKHAAARACLEEAVRRDPGYAEAWALLAYIYLGLAATARVLTILRPSPGP